MMNMQYKRNKNQSTKKLRALQKSIDLLIIGSIVLLSASCSPPIIPIPADESAPTGAVRDLKITETDSSFFTIQWTAPEDPGKKFNGTNLSLEELVYRIYYVEAITDQAMPVTADSILQHSEVKYQEVLNNVGEEVRATVTQLDHGTRYFITVATTFKSSIHAESLSIIVETNTIELLDYARNTKLDYKDEYAFFTEIEATFEPESRPLIPVTDTNTVIEYTLIKEDGVDFIPSLSIDSSGVITIPSITNTGVATYTVQATASGYATQEESIKITISTDDSSAPGPVINLEVVEERTTEISFVIQWETPENTGTKFDGTALKPEELAYYVYYVEEDLGSEQQTAGLIQQDQNSMKEEFRNVTRANIIGLEPDKRYLVVVSAYNRLADKESLPSNRLDLSTSEAATNVFNINSELSYLPEYSYATEISNDILIYPSTVPSTAGSETIYYSLFKISGEDFTPLLSIDESSGVIKIEANTNTGTAKYRVLASAADYTPQFATLSITITPRPTGAATNISINRITHESFVVEWDAPDDTGSDQDGRANSPDELVYHVYYLEGNPGQEAPTAETIQHSDSILKEETQNSSIDISGLHPDTRYFVAVATTYNSSTVAETSSDVVEVNTNALHEFVGQLIYTAWYQFIVNSEHSIEPNLRPVVQVFDTGNVDIRYTLDRLAGGVTFSSDPTINIRNGVITIPSITNIGEVKYTVRAEASGYRTQTATLHISIVSSPVFRVGTYHGVATDNFPLELGQAIKDDSNMPFALVDSESVLTFTGLTEGAYTIHFGVATEMYSIMLPEKQSNGGNLQLFKTELSYYEFPFIEGAVIGISGEGITDILHVATYYSMNIYDHHDLQAMRLRLDQNYVLMNHVVFPTTDPRSSNFQALGNTTNPFTGTLDGNSKRIKGLQIFTQTENYQGLFGVIEAGQSTAEVVKNIELRDFKIVGSTYVGSVAGWLKRGTIENVNIKVSASDTGKLETVGEITEGAFTYGMGGGLFGRAGTGAGTTQVTIQNSRSEMQVSGTGANPHRIGGLVGQADSDVSLSDVHMTGSVTATDGDAVGGLVGVNNATIANSSMEGDVRGNADVGGLVGNNNNAVTGYMTGNVTGITSVGGLGGINNSLMEGYVLGDVVGENSVGGLVGYNINKVSGYMVGNVTGITSVGGLGGINNGHIIGYVTGDVAGDYSVGGLVGAFLNNVTVTVVGYMLGSVSGLNNVGGLTGFTPLITHIVSGYARGIVRRRSGSELNFGAVGGSTQSLRGSVFSSVIENRIYDGEPVLAEEAVLFNTIGVQGTLVNVMEDSTQALFNTFGNGGRLIFGTDSGQWTWVADGMWPAINIGDIAPAGEQPLEFCINGSEEEREQCRLSTQQYHYSSDVKVTTYYNSTEKDIPTKYGQAIHDEGEFAMSDDTVVFTILGLEDGEYELYSGPQVGSFSNMLSNIESTDGSLVVLKSHIKKSNANINDGAVLGLSGSSFGNIILHVATYYPSYIYNHNDLQAMRQNLHILYILRNNIDFPFYSHGNRSYFEPIGSEDNPFTGRLNGYYWQISGLQIYTETEIYQGLFGKIVKNDIDSVAVLNINLVNFKVTGKAGVGSLVGWLKSGKISNVTVDARSKISISSSINDGDGDNGWGGGLVGRAGQIKIEVSSSEAEVSGIGENSNKIGGLVGSVESGSVVLNSNTKGNVTGKNFVGGLVGSNDGATISGHVTLSVITSGESGNSSEGVKGRDSVGGLVGENTGDGRVSGHVIISTQRSGIIVKNGVEGINRVGGLVGFNDGTVSGYVVKSERGFGLETVKGTGMNIGGLVGENNSGTVTGYVTVDVLGLETSNLVETNVGGLVGRNASGTVIGYNTGDVTGKNNIGGLVGFYESEAGQRVTGYFNGKVKGDTNVGGLVGHYKSYIQRGGIYEADRSIYFSGYALGTVEGKMNVGGLVGYVESLLNVVRETMFGYTRVTLRRTSEMFYSFGASYGNANVERIACGPSCDSEQRRYIATYYSSSESYFYSGSTGTISLPSSERSGYNGRSISFNAGTTSSNFNNGYRYFVFNDNLGSYTWVDGKWPAINLGTAYPFDGTTDAQSSATDQPINSLAYLN